jgi:hypothetical protein
MRKWKAVLGCNDGAMWDATMESYEGNLRLLLADQLATILPRSSKKGVRNRRAKHPSGRSGNRS